MLDNENLLDIWDVDTHPNLTIRNGIIFFHLNRKLCLYKIYDFRKAVGMDGRVDDADISPTNNGDQVACKLCRSALCSTSTQVLELFGLSVYNFHWS